MQCYQTLEDTRKGTAIAFGVQVDWDLTKTLLCRSQSYDCYQQPNTKEVWEFQALVTYNSKFEFIG